MRAGWGGAGGAMLLQPCFYFEKRVGVGDPRPTLPPDTEAWTDVWVSAPEAQNF